MCVCSENSQKQTPKIIQTEGRWRGAQVLDPPVDTKKYIFRFAFVLLVFFNSVVFLL